MSPDNIFEYVSIAMFVLVGFTLASAGVGVTDKPFHFFIVMIAMAVVKTIGLTH